MGGKPASLRSISEFFCKLHLYGWTGKINGETALMFAGTGSCDVGTATEKLLLTVIGAVTGDTAQTDSLVLTATDQFSGSICSSFFEKSFGIAGSTVKWKPDVDQIRWHIVRWKWILFIDQTCVISNHKNPPSFSSI